MISRSRTVSVGRLTAMNVCADNLGGEDVRLTSSPLDLRLLILLEFAVIA